jgi:hypothetical protein
MKDRKEMEIGRIGVCPTLDELTSNVQREVGWDDQDFESLCGMDKIALLPDLFLRV